MRQIVSIAPPYSVVFLADSVARVEVPLVDRPIPFTDTCVAVCCWPEIDGDTMFTLGDMADVDPGEPAVFDGTLKVPSGSISLTTAENQTIMRADTYGPTIHVKIWTNDARHPDRVIVGFE